MNIFGKICSFSNPVSPDGNFDINRTVLTIRDAVRSNNILKVILLGFIIKGKVFQAVFSSEVVSSNIVRSDDQPPLNPNVFYMVAQKVLIRNSGGNVFLDKIVVIRDCSSNPISDDILDIIIVPIVKILGTSVLFRDSFRDDNFEDGVWFNLIKVYMNKRKGI